MKMKQIVALLMLLGGLTAFAGKDNVVITFSTKGPDTYADGSVVRDGESYALVWTKSGSTFAGINPDGTAAGDSKVAVRAPVATGGACPNIEFQIDETYAAKTYPNGSWSVVLCDTRRYATEDVKVTVDGEEIVQKRVKLDAEGHKVVLGVGGSVSGYGLVAANIGRTLASATGKATAAGELPAGVEPPKVKDFKVIDGNAYLYLSGTSSALSYGVAAGATPGDLKATAERPVMGNESGETIVITPATGSSGFFQGIVK